MDAGDSGARQSGNPPANNSEDSTDKRQQPPRQRIETSYREGLPPMATAALMSPSGPYHSHHSSFSGYPHSAPATSIPGMISPVDSRRTSDGSETNHRQSLPSISEIISGTKSYAPPVQAPMSSSQGLPSPFASSAPSRPYGDVVADTNPSPRTLHPTTGYPRTDTLTAFSDPARPAIASRPIPAPLNTFTGQHPSPPVKMEQADAENRRLDVSPYSAGHHHPSSQPNSAHYSQSGRLPPGQLPLGYPISPQQSRSAPALPSPFETRTPVYGDEAELARGNEHKPSMDESNETWGHDRGYEELMQSISSTARTLVAFSDGYTAAAREQHGSQPILSRLPTDNELDIFINNSLLITRKLEKIRQVVRQQNRLNTERTRENGGRKVIDDDDVPMYEGLKNPYGSDGKKRRGRAAPPGRCHSCNRVDTPEWRRGPDGARTLCNACGLHYAKLERKRQLDQRSLRAKQMDDRN